MTFPPPTTETLAPVHTGLWWNPKQDGQGLWLKVTEDRFWCYWFAYDWEGNRRWLMGGGTLQEGIDGFTLQYKDGDFAHAALRFTSDTKGVFMYRGGDLGIGCIDIELLGRAGTATDGLYYDEAHRGEGFAIQNIGGKDFLYWYHADGTWDLCVDGAVLRPFGNGLLDFEPVEYEVVGEYALYDAQTPIGINEEMTFTKDGVTQSLQRLF